MHNAAGGIDYDIILREMAEGVVRRVLSQVAESGLPQGHHFLISFATRHPGVKVPASLRMRYPDRLAVVIQFQFWDLQVTDADFSVTLTFGGKRDSIVVPFAALMSFEDPSVPFHLRFTPPAEDTAAAGPAPSAVIPPAPEGSAGGNIIKGDFGKRES